MNFERDLAHCIALADQRRDDIARRRQACRDNSNLCAILQADAQRRGQPEIDWDAYFTNIELF